MNRYAIYFLAQVATIFVVTALFALIPDKQFAATIAGILFVGMPAVLLALEVQRRSELHRGIWFFSVLQFWLLFAIPILGLRIFNWNVPFAELSVFGIPGPTMHQWSSKSYFVMMIATLIFAWRERLNTVTSKCVF